MYLVCILFGMPSQPIYVTVRPKPKKNISSVTTTPKLETALTFDSLVVAPSI